MTARAGAWRGGAARLVLGAALCWAAARASTLPRPALTAEQARALWEKAVEQRGEGFPKKSLSSVKRLLASYPDNPIYLMHAADLYRDLKDPVRETAALELFMGAAPFPTEACPRLGQAYRLAGKLEQALAAHRRCLELDPTKADLMLYVGLELEQQGRSQDAELFFRRVLERVPDYADAVMGLARISFARADDAGARRLVDGLLASHPNDADALLVSAHIDEKEGRLKEAQEKLLTAAKVTPSYADLFRALGRVSVNLGDRPRALEAYRTLHQLEPGDAAASRQLEDLQRGQPK